MTVGDFYYVLFPAQVEDHSSFLGGHSWLPQRSIILNPPPYQSQAKLLIKYVPQVEASDLAGKRPESDSARFAGRWHHQCRNPDSDQPGRGGEAATNIGAANILAKVGGGNDPIAAANLIRGNLQAEPAEQPQQCHRSHIQAPRPPDRSTSPSGSHQ